MSLIDFVLQLFGKLPLKSRLESIRKAARQDAALAVGTYADEFEAEAGRILRERQRRLVGGEVKVVKAKRIK